MDSMEELRERYTLKTVGDFTTPPFVKRYEGNPVLSADKVPYRSDLVFNSSVIEKDGRYIMLFRNDCFPVHGVPEGAQINFGVAESDDGYAWRVWDKPVFSGQDVGLGNAYDPRLIPIEGRYYVTCCVSTDYGEQAVTMVTDNLTEYTVIDVSPPCSRNTVLFPEKINGKYYRLERPFWQAVDSLAIKTGLWISKPYHIWIASSPDLKHWGDYKPVVNLHWVNYANTKIGTGGFPIRTDRGWLVLMHGVDLDPSRGKNGWEYVWKSRYHGGAALLDLDDPTRCIGIMREPLLTPEASYETDGGYRNNVVFPMAGILRENDELVIYYGAADTHVCIATAPLADVLDMCRPVDMSNAK